MNQDRSAERAKEIHEKAIVVDMHSDIMIDVSERRSHGDKRVLLDRHIPLIKKGGINARCTTVGGDSNIQATFPLKSIIQPLDRTMRTMQNLDCFYQELDESKDAIALATTAEEVEKAFREGKTSFILALEGAKPIGENLSMVRILHKLGIRLVGLTWNFRNQVADGAVVSSESGLSDFGFDLIKEMNKVGVMIDVSHLSEKGFWDTIKNSSDPVIVSHSNTRHVCYHKRNLSDEQIKAIAENGGVIGLTPLIVYTSKKDKPTLNDYIEHIEHIERLVGVNHVGVGLDLLEMWPEKIYNSIWGPMGIHYIEELDSVTKLPLLTKELVSRGYSDSEIEKVLGRNFLRVFASVCQG